MAPDENAIKEKMELVAEAIFSVLYQEGDMEVQELRTRVNVPTPAFDMAIGALVEKDDVQLIRRGDTVIAHRTDPALAVLPFRGN